MNDAVASIICTTTTTAIVQIVFVLRTNKQASLTFFAVLFECAVRPYIILLYAMFAPPSHPSSQLPGRLLFLL